MDNITQNYTVSFERCFLSLPHGFGTVREQLKEMLRRFGIRPKYVISSEGTALRDSVTTGLLNSSLLIADLSSARSAPPKSIINKGPRPNIMWEIGYAWHADMSVLIICRKDDMPNVPALLSDQHIIYYEIDNLVPMLNEAFDALLIMSDRVSRISPGRKLHDIYNSRCYVNRFVADIPRRIRLAENKIRILELNLETITSYYIPALLNTMKEHPNLSVQICTLNPFSEFVSARAHQLAEIPLVYQLQLFQSIEKTNKELLAITGGLWELRIYDTFPTQIMFQIDDALIHSIVTLGRRSRDSLHFEVQRQDKNAEDTFEAHFAQLWGHSTPYDLWEKNNAKSIAELKNRFGIEALENSIQQQYYKTQLLMILYLSDGNAKEVNQIERRIGEFASNLDFEVVTCSLEEISSLFGEILLGSKNLLKPDNLAKLYSRIVKAFSEKTPDKIVGPLSDFLKEHQNVVIQIGSVLIIKNTNKHRQSDVVVMELTKEQVEHLQSNKALLMAPCEIQKSLQELGNSGQQCLAD